MNKSATALSDIEQRIEDALNEGRPFLLRDGGDISLVKFENGVAFVTLHGACATCPVSAFHLKIGIEELVKAHVEEVIEVREFTP